MDERIETKIKAICDQMAVVGDYIDEVSGWLNGHMKKAIDGNSTGDWLLGALFGGGIIGMAISKKIRTGKKSTKIIYNGMTADDMGQDIVNQVSKLVDYQVEIQKLASREEKGYYYGLVNLIFECWYTYHKAWMMFTSFYCTNHKVEYNAEKLTLEEMVRRQCMEQINRLDLNEEAQEAVNKYL